MHRMHDGLMTMVIASYMVPGVFLCLFVLGLHHMERSGLCFFIIIIPVWCFKSLSCIFFLQPPTVKQSHIVKKTCICSGNLKEGPLYIAVFRKMMLKPKHNCLEVLNNI